MLRFVALREKRIEQGSGVRVAGFVLTNVFEERLKYRMSRNFHHFGGEQSGAQHSGDAGSAQIVKSQIVDARRLQRRIRRAVGVRLDAENFGSGGFAPFERCKFGRQARADGNHPRLAGFGNDCRNRNQPVI